MNSILNNNSLFILSILLLFASCDYPGDIKIISVELNSIDDILPIEDSLVTPVEYSNSISFSNIPLDQKKRKFIELILPSILIAKHQLKIEQYNLKKLLNKDTAKLNREKKLYLSAMLKRFKADSLESLLSKLETHPTSIIIAQAAMESGWGTSRFFTEANNIFGVWSYNPNENRIKSTYSRDGVDIFLRKYEFIHESITDYFVTLARGPYKKFRLKRLDSTDPYDLTPLLYNYSELRGEYIKILETVIRSNNLTMYDNYIIDKKYINKYW